MMNKHAIYYIKYWLPMIIGAFMLLSCDHKDEPDTPPTPKGASRTVLVYMVATNNLGTGGFDQSDIDEMLVGATEGQIGDGRLLVYHASTDGIVLKEITQQGIDTLKVYDNQELSVSVARMRQVIADVKEISPSKDYGLVLWSHATGWLQDGIDEQLPQAWRSYGSDGLNNGKKMNITSMAYALHDARLSFIYFDCCYMGSVETLYEMRDCADIFVASPTEDPADGMPYQLNLKNLFDTTSSLETAMLNAASTTFNFYNDVYVVGQCPCTMTVVRANKLEELAQKTRLIYSEAQMTSNPDYKYQKFKDKGQCPYYDLDQYVESICIDNAMLEDWRKTFDEAVIYAEATSHIWSYTPINRCCGLSTNIITSKSAATTNSYNTLSWYKDVATALF